MPDIFDPALFDPALFDTGAEALEPSMYTKEITCALGGGVGKRQATFIGEAFTLECTLADTDITGWTFAFRLKGDFDEIVVDEEDGFSITSAEDGEFEFAAPAELTAELTARHYTWEIWRIDAGQEFVLAWGTWLLRW